MKQEADGGKDQIQSNRKKSIFIGQWLVIHLNIKIFSQYLTNEVAVSGLTQCCDQ